MNSAEAASLVSSTHKRREGLDYLIASGDIVAYGRAEVANARVHRDHFSVNHHFDRRAPPSLPELHRLHILLVDQGLTPGDVLCASPEVPVQLGNLPFNVVVAYMVCGGKARPSFPPTWEMEVCKYKLNTADPFVSGSKGFSLA